VRPKWRQESERKQGAPDWMVTYSDMVTLVLCFFVLLFSYSSIDEAKFGDAMISLREAFGVLLSGRALVPQDVTPLTAEELAGLIKLRDMEQINKVQEMIDQRIQEANLAGTVELIRGQRGLTIRFADRVLFDSGQADLKPAGITALQVVGDAIRGLPNDIRVEGHTDSIPINTRDFPSNWELSTRRATNVVRYLVEGLSLPAQQLSAAGYAEHRPIADNGTLEGRRLNRRVDIVVLSLLTTSQEPTTTESDWEHRR